MAFLARKYLFDAIFNLKRQTLRQLIERKYARNYKISLILHFYNNFVFIIRHFVFKCDFYRYFCLFLFCT